MTEFNWEIDRFHEKFSNGTPLWFIAGCVLSYNFKSFRRFLIYIMHYGDNLDLWTSTSKEITNAQIIARFQPIIKERVPKKLLMQVTGIKSRTTFNKHFATHIALHNLKGRKTFTLLEAYHILEYWQGKGKWGRLQVAKKKMLAGILHNMNYERTAIEFKQALNTGDYDPDLISPKKIKQLIKHIDLSEENQIEDLMGYQELQTGLLWMFGILLLHHFLSQNEGIDNT